MKRTVLIVAASVVVAGILTIVLQELGHGIVKEKAAVIAAVPVLFVAMRLLSSGKPKPAAVEESKIP